MNIESGKERRLPGEPGEADGPFRMLSGLCARMGIRRSAVFLSRFACRPLYFIEWFRFLSSFTQQHGLDRPTDDLIRKKTYRFFAHGHARSRGLELLVDHFKLAEATMSRKVLESMWNGLPVSIGTVAGKRDSYGLSLCLSEETGTKDEGAFSIKLTRQSDQFDLVTLSFILYKLGNFKYTVAVGGIQGSSRLDSKRAFIDVTRDMSGLRPKDALLLIAEGMAIRAGADHLLAISNIKHSINERVRKNRLKKHADLDSYWVDRGGKTGGEFGFVMPVKNGNMEPPLDRRDMCKFQFLGIGKNLVALPNRLDPA